MHRTHYDRLRRIFTESLRGVDIAEAMPRADATAGAARTTEALQVRGESFVAVADAPGPPRPGSGDRKSIVLIAERRDRILAPPREDA